MSREGLGDVVPSVERRRELWSQNVRVALSVRATHFGERESLLVPSHRMAAIGER